MTPQTRPLKPLHTIAVANQKGGACKTTTAVSVAAGLALRGHPTTLVDIDAQCNASTGCGYDTAAFAKAKLATASNAFLAKTEARKIAVPLPDLDELVGAERLGGNLRVVVGSRGINGVHEQLQSEHRARSLSSEDSSILDMDDGEQERRMRLRTSIRSLEGKSEFCIIDTPPNLGFLTMSALIAAHTYIIPVTPSGYDVDGLKAILSNVKKIRARYNPELALLGVITCRMKDGANLDEGLHQQLMKRFGDHHFGMRISESVRHREGLLAGKTIFEMWPKEPAAQQYLELTDLVVQRVAALQASSPDGSLPPAGEVVNV